MKISRLIRILLDKFKCTRKISESTNIDEEVLENIIIDVVDIVTDSLEETSNVVSSD